jgi:RHS repeat-associated protein
MMSWMREIDMTKHTSIPSRLILLALLLCAGAVYAQPAFRGASSSTVMPPQFRSAASSATPSAITFRASASASFTASAGTLTVTKPAGTAADDVMIASIGFRPNTATITPPAGWTLVRRMDNPNSNPNSLAVYRKVAGASEPASYAWSFGGATDATGGIQSFIGVDTVNPVDVENGNCTPQGNCANGSLTTHATPSVTTTVANTMVVTSHSFSSSSTWTPPSGMTESIDVASQAPGLAGQAIEGNRVVQAAIGATGVKTATAATAPDVGNAHILALRPAALGLITINKPAGATENDVLIASIGVRPSTATLTPPAGWTLVRRIDNANSNSNSLAVYRKVAGAAEPVSYAWTLAGSTQAIGGIQAFFNVDTANPIDVENGQATPNALTHATPSVVTTVANTLVVTSHAFSSAATWTPPAGMTEGFDIATPAPPDVGGQAVEGNWVAQAAAGATGIKTATGSNDADAGNAHILALRPAAPGLTLNKPAGTTVNDVMIAAIGLRPSTATLTPPAGWTLVRRMDNPAENANSLAVYRKVAGAAEAGSYAWTLAGATHAVGGIQSFSGVDTANPIDVEAGQATANALTHATPSVVTTVANTMVVSSHTFSSAATWTPPAGMTESFDIASPTAPNIAGQAIEGNRVVQAAAGATGIKTANAANDADVGNTHILALRPFVNTAPTVSLTSPANNATFTAPASIILTADAQDTDGTVTQVEFFQGATLIATRTVAPYSILWTGVLAGSYSLTARVTDNQGAATTSAAVNVTVNTGVAQMYFIHTDHLNTPRVITNQAAQVVWRWDHAEPFGSNPPNENPSGLGAFTCNLRLPGQYFDRETNTHYNYFRDYDPGIGRFPQSDPIGLAGGINTYSYVGSNPLSRTDPLGLFAFAVHVEITRNAAGGTKCQSRGGALGQMVGNVDFRSGAQSVRNANEHAMSIPGQLPSEAEIGTNQFIEENLKNCSLDDLARALHATQDKYSGSHSGYQPWPGGTPSFGHMVQDTFLGRGSPRRAEADSRDLIKRFAEMCPCVCN